MAPGTPEAPEGAGPAGSPWVRSPARAGRPSPGLPRLPITRGGRRDVCVHRTPTVLTRIDAHGVTADDDAKTPRIVNPRNGRMETYDKRSGIARCSRSETRATDDLADNLGGSRGDKRLDCCFVPRYIRL